MVQNFVREGPPGGPNDQGYTQPGMTPFMPPMEMLADDSGVAAPTDPMDLLLRVSAETGIPIEELLAQLVDMGPPEPTRRRKRRKRPSLDVVKRRCDDSVAYWATRDTRMDEDFLLYSLDRSDYESGDGEVVILNTPYAVVEKGSRILAKQKPNIDVIPPTSDLKDEAASVEDLVRYAWKVWDKEWVESLHGELQRDIAHNGLLRGWIAMRIRYDSDGVADDPSAFPVRLTPYDPRQVYPMPGSRGLRYVVHRYLVTYEELIDEWPEAEELYQIEQSPDAHIEVTSYFDKEWHGVYTDAGWVKKPQAHDYGFVPWIIRVCDGSAERSHPTTSKELAVSTIGTGILHGMKGEYLQLNKLLSQLATEVAKSANPPMLYYYDHTVDEDVPEAPKLEAGAINFLRSDRERIEPMRLSPNPSDLMPLVDALRSGLTKATFPEVAWGNGGDASGFAQSLMSDSVEDALRPYSKAVASAMEEASSRMLRLLRDFHEAEVSYTVMDQASGIRVSGMTLPVHALEGVGTNVEVSFRQVSPRDRAMMANLASMLTDKKLISLRTARDEYLEIENPDKENEMVLEDLVYLDEKVVKMVLEASLKRSNPALYSLYKEANSQPEAPPPPPPTPPGLPGMPPNVMPPIQQAAMTDPMALLNQSLGSAAGGAGLQAPVGIPGQPLLEPSLTG